MKYNQPFDQPSSPNAPYVDGNPSAGIQGSIVPAASIEFDQREIVRAIEDVGLAVPTNSDLSQLSQSIRYMRPQYCIDQGSINTIMVSLNPQPPAWATPLCFFVLIGFTNTLATVTCAITGIVGSKGVLKRDGTSLAIGDLVQHAMHLFAYDGSSVRCLTPVASEIGTGGSGGTLDLFIDAPTTYTVGGPGTPNFTTLPLAIEFLSKHIITANGSVLLQLAAGVMNFSADIQIDHPNCDRIILAGATMLGPPPTAGDFVGTGLSGSAMAADNANQLAMLRSKYATELHFAGSTLYIGNGLTVRNLLVTGDGVGSTVGIACRGGRDPVQLAAVSVHGTGGSGFTIRNGLVLTTAVISASGCCAGAPTANLIAALDVSDGGHLFYYGEVIAASNYQVGMTCIGGTVRLKGILPSNWSTPGYPITCKFNVSFGLYISNSGSVTSQQAVFNNNDYGIMIDTGSMYGQGFSFAGNIHWGLYGLQSAVQIQGTPPVNGSGNGSGGIYANYNTTVVVSGISGQPCSPPLNVAGNVGSLISGN